MAALPEPLLQDEPVQLITVEEYRELANREDVTEELHWGQIVPVSFPKHTHKLIQLQLLRLLQERAGQLGVVDIESAFRALPQYEIRGADVAFISRDRFSGISGQDNLHGSPELVLEVLSPSNTRREMQEKAALCLATGAEEFWIVNPARQNVTVLRRNGERSIYSAGDSIPLALFGNQLQVSEIFDLS